MTNLTELLDFLDQSPTAFHAVENLKQQLLNHGFHEFKETEAWSVDKGTKGFVIRNGSSILAFDIGSRLTAPQFNIVASHTDSPSYKLKPNHEMSGDGAYQRLNVEPYGGMIASTWLDRPLAIAGRLFYQTPRGMASVLVNSKQPIALIPNVAIHLNRNINNGYTYNPQVDLLPMVALHPQQTVLEWFADQAGLDVKDILDFDLYLSPTEKATQWGLNQEFFSSGRIDNLECSFTTLQGFLQGEQKDAVNIYCSFDNEEVGSMTKQGAFSTFLVQSLTRLHAGLQLETSVEQMLAHSFMISADNVHALHPNHPELYDQSNRAMMNGGIVIKYNSNQKYTTDALSGALLRALCRRCDVPVQSFTNRSDMIGGSTLGSLSLTQVSIPTVDIGLAQLAMHSSYETAGALDPAYLEKAIVYFYHQHFVQQADGELWIEANA